MTSPARRLIASASALAATILEAPPACAQYEVYDPWTYQEQAITYGQAVEQVAQGVEQLQALQSQLQAQQSMLQSLGSDATAATLASVNAAAQQILAGAGGIGFTSPGAGGGFANLYPGAAVVGGFNTSQLNAALATWQANNTAALQTAVQIQGQVASNQTATASAVQNAVNASNTAPGQTAAIQATNQLLAAVATQLSQLQAILITQGQAQAALAGQQQASAAAAQSAGESTAAQVQTAITPAPGVTDTSHM